MIKIISLILLAQFTVPMHTGALAVSGSSCSMPSSGALAEYYASATGGGAPSSCTGAAITSWGDNSGNGKNLTATGSPTCTTASINGKSSVNLTASPYFSTARMACTTTCSFYMVAKMNSLSTNSAFMASDSNTALAYQVTTAGKQELDQQNTVAIGTSTTAVAAGAWHEFAWTYSGGTVNFYLDGVADGSGSAAATITVGPIYIGTNYSSVPGVDPANANIGNIYISSVGSYQPAVHSCMVTRFGV